MPSKGITIQDGIGILKGGDFAATTYLQGRTAAQLTEAFRPVIEQSLQKVDATKHWKTLFSTYNTFSKEQVNTDLSAYVTEKALVGHFLPGRAGRTEDPERPNGPTTDLLRKYLTKRGQKGEKEEMRKLDTALFFSFSPFNS
jgi:hypothetical protein